MAQLYFKYGAMGSSKTANALMARFNNEERGQQTLLVKPRLDTRDGDHMVVSRIGLKYPCIYFDELQALTIMELQQNACIIVDEAQFLTKEEVKTICWCGKKAIFNARFDSSGKVLKEGAQVVLGANDQYIGLCRKHWRSGDLGPDFDVNSL